MADPMNPELAKAIVASANRLGVDPMDIATTISYETGGRNSPSIYGGAGGKYLGLIQFSPENQAKYGVRPDQTAAEQMGAVEAYLRDRGVKPKMGLPDIYSTVNAGSPGRYNASDANNGGAPGTVMDKVQSQMAGHRVNAARLLGLPQVGMINSGSPAAPVTASGAPAAAATAPASVPAAAVPSDSGGNDALMAQLQAIPKMLAAQQQNQTYAPAAPVANNMAARLAAIAAAKGQAA